MSKLSNAKSKVLGYISSIRTLLDNFPELKLTDSLLNLLNSNTPFGFLMNLLAIVGLSPRDILNWCSRTLCGQEVLMIKGKFKENAANTINKAGEAIDGKVTQGFLDILEEAIKVLLLTNVKDMFTCSLNPLIPNDVLRYPRTDNNNSETVLKGTKGIEISLPTIDMFNVLYHAPNSKYGKTLYFDNEYSGNDMWKSTDFNAFLWFIINKGSNVRPDDLKNIWDNRVRRRKELINNEIFSNNFFNINAGNGSFIKNEKQEFDVYTKNQSKENKKDKDSVIKHQYLIFHYNERSYSHPVPDTITVWLNADRYRRNISYGSEGRTFDINKTVFEFNYDYIYSLKLFDSKTLVANIINSLLGILNSSAALAINGKYSLEQNVIAGKVGEIVKKLMNGEDEVINDCFFSFSNEEYETLLRQAELKYSENYEFGEVSGKITDIDIDSIVNDLSSLNKASTLEEEQTIINNIFETVASATSAENGMVSINDKFTFSANILFDLIQMTVTEIVMQVLSPKVMLLYAINSYFMGDAADGDFTKINVENFIKGFSNLITSMAKQVFDLIMQELLKYLMEEVQELLVLLSEKLILERIQYYKEILRRLLALIDMFANALKGGPKADTYIDNVNYADIIPQQIKPKEEKC